MAGGLIQRDNSLRRAAILVASLDHETADLVLTQMGPEQADRVRRAILHLGSVDDQEQDAVIGEFCRIGPLVPEQHPPGIELDGELARLLVAPERDNALGGADLAEEKAPFQFLQESEISDVVPLLRREHPQTIAVVAAHLSPARASSLLAELPPKLQVEVVRRLADLKETDPEALQEVERGLEKWIVRQSETDQRRVDGLATLSAILEASDNSARRQLIKNLHQVDRPLASRLQPDQYTFADLMQFDDESLIVVLRAADPELIVLSLAGASVQLVDRVSRRLPAEQSRALAKALKHHGPTRLADVEEAQQALADLASDMELEGRITVRRHAMAEA